MNIDAKLIFKLISSMFIFFLVFNYNNLKVDLNEYYSFFPNESDKKYVIYECTDEDLCGGWADRLKGIMSAYAISLLTDRYFLIYNIKSCLLSDYFESNSYFLNESINYTQVDQLWFLNDLSYRESLRFVSAFNFTSKYISIKNNLDWIEPLSANPIFEKKINELGYNVKKFKIQFVFKEWYSKMFKLNSRLNEKYLKFLKKAKPNKNTKLICCQVRVGGGYDSDVFMEKEKTKIYWNYIRINFIKNLTDYRLFLTTDQNDVELEAFKEFGVEFLVTNEGPNNHLDLVYNSKSTNENLDRIFLDFHSLQNCNMAIISESGFGKLGIWNRNNPNENLAMYTNIRSVSESKLTKKL